MMIMMLQSTVLYAQRIVQNFTLKRTGPLEVLLDATPTNSSSENDTLPFVAIPSGTPLSNWASESRAELGGIFGRIFETPGSPREWLMRTSTSPFAHCSNGVLDEKETCVDGGGICTQLGRLCKKQQRCTQDTDCISGSYCSVGSSSSSSRGAAKQQQQGTCVSCFDGVRNGMETSIDCGGPHCVPCKMGSTCSQDKDCFSDSCVNGVCVSCYNMIQDGNETDIDCGGDTCRPCSTSRHCEIDSDCITDLCDPSLKQCDVFTEINQCSNQEIDDGEACEDAGGPLCGALLGHACYAGQTCRNDQDCESGMVCDSRSRRCASCFDSEKNGDETDLDCGGKSSRCEACSDGKMCDRNGDCMSNMCVQGVCSSCFNGIQDGDEVDVDCGGSCEKRCPLLANCTDHMDCVSKECSSKTQTCVSRSREIECETKCGGPRCRFLGKLCSEGGTCEKDLDCVKGLRCIEDVCMNCNTVEAKLDSRCGPLENGLWCEKDKDCLSGICKGKGPTRLCSSCWNGIMDGSETATDAGGVCEKKYGDVFVFFLHYISRDTYIQSISLVISTHFFLPTQILSKIRCW
jgi:hypothetical protein